MSHDHKKEEHHQSKKQSFVPYVVLILVAVSIIAIANAVAVYYTNLATEVRDHDVIASQQTVISSLARDYIINTHILNNTINTLKVNTLYHGILMYVVSQNNKQLVLNHKLGTDIAQKLDALIAAHNEMIQAIENATGHHTPIINNNKITNVHNTYCTIYVEKPECKDKKPTHH